ncbi:MAG: hypothetical protein QXN62_05580 [Candidatus Bathyarchaeia archaeon]
MMTVRERLMTTLRGGVADRIPIAGFDRHLLQGEKEREARNRGLGLICHRPCYIESILDTEVLTKSGGPNTQVKIYNTPVGSVNEVLSYGAGYGIALFGRDWQGVVPRRKEFLVKKPEDYKVLKYIVENLHYEPYYFAIEDQMKRLGEDGIVVATLPYEPMHRILIEFVDWKRFYMDLVKNREAIEEIYEILKEKYIKELYPIAANSPAEVVMVGANIDSILVNPPLFEKYYISPYEECAEILHPKGKLLNVHMDGRLKALRDHIAKTRLNVIEAFTPPPMGDLPIDEALNIWKNKVLWINFPSTISTLMGPSPKNVKKYLIDLLEHTIPGERITLIVSTENRVPTENMMAMVEVMEKAELPLTKETIEDMRRNL